MATTKTKATTKLAPARGKAAPTKSIRKPAPAAPETGGSSTAEQPLKAELQALDGSYADPPATIPVIAILQEGRELQGVMRRLRPRVLAGSRLDPALADSLPARIEALDAADARWTDLRTYQLPSSRTKLRVQAEGLRGDSIAALRHFLPQNQEVQARVNQIAEGTGIADLIDDLKKLAVLVGEQSPALVRAGLPPKASDKLSAFAQQLDEATTEAASASTGTDEGREALGLRNRAYWYLREAIDEIRECGRHALRKEPALAKHFRSSYLHHHRTPKGPKTPKS
jgi:hypothetical protein